MFTGIIQHVGVVAAVARQAQGRRLTIDVGPLAAALPLGASLAVDGACLTVARLAGTKAEFDVVPETLERTTLDQLAPGSPVNLEPALTLSTPLDGHLVQGHVDGLAVVAGVDRAGGAHLLRLRAGADLTDQLVHKGSVALAGVSLTVAELSREHFAVALVPTTLERTRLGKLRPGEKLNVETDILGKYVRRWLQAGEGAGAPAGAGLTLEELRQAGLA